jgi:hypothetical protein
MGDANHSADGQSRTSDPKVRAAGEWLAEQALGYVQDSAGRVRVEDYIAILAALAGEAALLSAGLFDLETAGFTPGSAIFGDAINDILTGDTDDPAVVPEASVLGILVRELVPTVAPAECFASPGDIYKHVAASVNAAGWGCVTTTVGDEHEPGVMPIRATFELRAAVDEAQSKAGLPIEFRYVPCALALATGIRQVRDAQDVRLTVQLALEVVFGMAKMAPMTRAAFNAVAADASAATRAEPHKRPE